jgi:hypothetical protein
VKEKIITALKEFIVDIAMVAGEKIYQTAQDIKAQQKEKN